jgi:hypothetical protein
MEFLSAVGALCFGGVIGWITRYILAFAKEITINGLATIIGALGGAAIVKLFSTDGIMFPFYCIGLACGFGIFVLLYDIDDKGSIKRR